MRHALTFTFAILLLTFGASAQSVPERWIDAYNSGAAATMEAFATANYAPSLLERRSADERRAMYEQIWQNHGRFDVRQVRMRGGTAKIDVQPERGQPLRITFQMDPNPPNRIVMLSIDANDGQEEEKSPLPPFEPGADFNASLDAYLRKIDFSGAVLIAKGDEIQFEKAYGLASRRFNVPNKITTRFDIGSITKDFTKVAIGQLAQAGKLKVTDTIAKHLPDYPNKDVRDRVTIEQLVRNASGLGDIFTPEYFAMSRMRLRKLADYVPIFADDPLLFEPGTNRRYSNYGYIVLGLIIEAVSGESYYDYVKRNIFDPAGMTASGFFESDKVVPDVAMGHTQMIAGTGERGTEWMENSPRLPIRGASAGSSHSTARDLFNFDRALRQHRLLKPGWTRWFYGAPVPTADDKNMSIVKAPGAFAGGAPGVNAVVVSDGDSTIVVLANIDPPVAEALGERVIQPALSKRAR